jgi:hypothetical protein
MGMLMEDEEIPLDRSWIAYIPAGIMHMPTITPGGKISKRPVCHWTSGPGGVYTREKDKESTKSESGKEGEFKRSKSTHSTPRSEARGMLRVDTERRFLPQFKNQGLAPSNVSKPGELRNAKYIVFGDKQSAKMPPYMREMDPKYTRPMAHIDETVIPGAEFGCDTRWLLPGEKSKAGQLMMDTHALPHGTSIVFNAMNYEDITDLCAEVELWIGGEKHIINKSFGAYIPPDVKQGPMIIRNIAKQIFFMMSYPIGEGIKKYRGR